MGKEWGGKGKTEKGENGKKGGRKVCATWRRLFSDAMHGAWTPIRMYKKYLDCDRFNLSLLLARIIFSCILLSAFSFLSTCIRDPASI